LAAVAAATISASVASSSVGDVVADAGAEEQRLLQHHRHRLAQRVAPVGGDVAAIDEDAAAGRPVEPQQQAHDGGLAGARRSDDRHPLARGHAEAGLAQGGPARFVLEGHAVEREGALQALHVNGVGRVVHVRQRLEHARDASRAHLRPGELGRKLGQIPHRPVEAVQIRREDEDGAHAQAAGHHFHGADPDDDGRGSGAHELDRPRGERVETRGMHGVRDLGLVVGLELRVFVALAAEGLRLTDENTSCRRVAMRSCLRRCWSTRSRVRR
jgi:hypothetical protein